MTPILETRGLRLGYKGRELCGDLNWQLRAGECWAILGPNGAGKTTLLHALAGLRRPDAGEVFIEGVPMARLSRRAIARGVGILFQQVDYPFPTTVLETVLAGRYPHLGFWTAHGRVDEEMAWEALRTTGLEALATRPVESLSGGERRRMEAVTLLLQAPRVFLLDEPTNHLDLGHQIALLKLFAGRVRQTEGTMVLVTHDIHLAARFCDHILLLAGNGGSEQGTDEAMLQPERLTRLFGHPLRVVDAGGQRFWVAI
ncbi:MAG: ABC transporter ATP-binding protein [Magnetococcus sp. YQC-9]